MRPFLPLLCLLTLAGCGLDDPTSQRAPDATTVITSPDPDGDPPIILAPKPSQLPPRAHARAQDAVAAFANASMNWNWLDVVRVHDRLAKTSIGAARQSEQQAAAELAADTSLRDAGISSSGAVVSIAPAHGAPANTFAVVTRERVESEQVHTQAQATYQLTFATVQHLDDGWVVSAWERTP